MSIQAIPVFGQAAESGFTWPDITVDVGILEGTPAAAEEASTPTGGDEGVTGDEESPVATAAAAGALKRYAKQYDGVWYAEYACWGATAGTTFTVGADGVTADFFLISPGEAGAAGSSTNPGAGGGAGVPFTQTGVELAPGNYTIVISSTVTRVTGTDVSISAITPTGGAASGTPYRLYGDANSEYGQAGAKGSPGAITPGSGASGCTFLPVSASRTVFGGSSSSASVLPGAIGVGAGGNGGGNTSYLTGNISALAAPGAGAVGMALFRVAL
jgi:hypothetical protein